MTVNPTVAPLPCERPDCRHVRNLLAQSVPLTDLDGARARIAVLESALCEAADDIESWGAYAAKHVTVMHARQAVAEHQHLPANGAST